MCSQHCQQLVQVIDGVHNKLRVSCQMDSSIT